VIKNIVKGKPDPLNSNFYIRYNMILNLLRMQDMNPKFII